MARSRGSTLRKNLDDATQEVFIEIFRQGGVLEAAGTGRIPNFRAFLYGVIRNVARRFESQPSGPVEPLPDILQSPQLHVSNDLRKSSEPTAL